MNDRPVIAVLVSGSGSNLQAIIDASERGEIPGRVGLVVSNKADAYGLTRAGMHGIPTAVVDHKAYESREAFDAKLVEVIRASGAVLVCLAGFMRVVTPVFLRAFPHRILNIHPALLPSFPGTHGVRDALEHGAKVSGVTVHFVDEGLDTGPIIVQEAVPVEEGDDEETLHNRIHLAEYRQYPKAIRLFAEGRLEIDGRTVRIIPESIEERG